MIAMAEKIINVNVTLNKHRTQATVEWVSGQAGTYGYLFYAQGIPSNPSLLYSEVILGPVPVARDRFIVQVSGLNPRLPYSFYVQTVAVENVSLTDSLGNQLYDNEGEPIYVSSTNVVLAEMEGPQYLLNPIAPAGVVPISGGFPLVGPIQLGRNRAIDFAQGTLPNLFDSFDDWMQNMIFEKVGKVVSEDTAFQAVETTTRIPFRGLIVPEKAWELQIKPIAQRAWKYFKCYAEAALPLQPDDIILWQGGQYRVTAVTDYSMFGYMEYELAQDWLARGPIS